MRTRELIELGSSGGGAVSSYVFRVMLIEVWETQMGSWKNAAVLTGYVKVYTDYGDPEDPKKNLKVSNIRLDGFKSHHKGFSVKDQ